MNTLLLWVVFHVFIVALLLFDLGVVQRRDQEMSVRTALWLSLGYIALALVFGAGVFHFRGTEAGYEFLTGYFIEKSLSIDNIFVFLLIFLHFSVPRHAQRTVLLYGVLGALVMRAVLIFAGAAAIASFHWLLYVFGLFLVASGVKMLVAINQEPDMSRNRIVRFMRSRFRVTDEYEGEKFWVRRDGLWYMTPMFIVLVIVETSDVIFALDLGSRLPSASSTMYCRPWAATTRPSISGWLRCGSLVVTCSVLEVVILLVEVGGDLGFLVGEPARLNLRVAGGGTLQDIEFGHQQAAIAGIHLAAVAAIEADMARNALFLMLGLAGFRIGIAPGVGGHRECWKEEKEQQGWGDSGFHAGVS